jgi:ribosomal protein S18 acetylase RimI-like enzyme
MAAGVNVRTAHGYAARVDLLAETWRFEVAIQDRGSERIEPFRWGSAIFRLDMPRVHDQNLLRLERGFDEVSARELEAEADRIQRPAGLSHRKVIVPDEEAGERLASEFAELGWRRARHVVMALRGDAPGESLHSVREVESPALREARTRAFEGELGRVAAGQVAASLDLIASVVPTRAFAVEADGVPVSWCALYEEDGIGQIDDVVTDPDYRRRGFGRAVVEAAMRASVADGNRTTFLVADDEDWPKELYARLGFEPIGRRYEFTRS